MFNSVDGVLSISTTTRQHVAQRFRFSTHLGRLGLDTPTVTWLFFLSFHHSVKTQPFFDLKCRPCMREYVFVDNDDDGGGGGGVLLHAPYQYLCVLSVKHKYTCGTIQKNTCVLYLIYFCTSQQEITVISIACF